MSSAYSDSSGAANHDRNAACRGALVSRGRFSLGAVENEAVHAVEQVARKFEHLLGGGGEFGGTGSGLLNEFAHFVHGANDGLRTGCLLFDGGIDFLGDFGQAAGGFGDLRRSRRTVRWWLRRFPAKTCRLR